jgi:hypothetical protein
MFIFMARLLTKIGETVQIEGFWRRVDGGVSVEGVVGE